MADVDETVRYNPIFSFQITLDSCYSSFDDEDENGDDFGSKR